MASKLAPKLGGLLKRPPEMGNVHQMYDRICEKVVLGTVVASVVICVPPMIIWELKWQKWWKEYDTDAVYEKQKKAGVFMSIRSDGSYRRFYTKLTDEDAHALYIAPGNEIDE